MRSCLRFGVIHFAFLAGACGQLPKNAIPYTDFHGDGSRLPNVYLRLYKTPEKDRYGLVVLGLQLVRGGVVVDTIPAVSGVPSKQEFRTVDESQGGSLEPLPEGTYRLGTVQWAAGDGNWNASFGEGLGAMKVSITSTKPNAIDRSELLFHYDANEKTSPGSAGCVVFGDAVRDKFVRWMEEEKLGFLLVDWELGTVPQPRLRPGTSSNQLAKLAAVEADEGSGT